MHFFNRQPSQDDFSDVGFCAGMVNVDSDDITQFVVIQHDPYLHLTAVDTRLARKINIERICFRVIIDFHGLKFLSGNAL